jgi:hypothetical protein
MSTLKVTIGEHVLHVMFQSEFSAELFHVTFPEIKESSKDHVDLYVELRAGFGSPFKNYDISSFTDNEGYRHYTRTDYKLSIDSNYRYAAISVYDELALKHALMHLMSTYIVHHGWGLLIHSSCILENGHAHLFAGHSGAGKSTVTALSLPRGIFSDEATLVKISSDVVTVFHSPFRSEFHTNLNEQLTPSSLSSIQILHQSPTNRRLPIKKTDGLLTLMNKVFYWSPSPEVARKILGKLKEMVEIVPVYELHFRKEPTFWELIT